MDKQNSPLSGQSPKKQILIIIHPATLYAMRDSGVIERISRGLYRLAGSQPLGNPDLVTVAARISGGVICLISALSFHELTTQIPHEVHVALPYAEESSRPFNELLQHYAIERFLYRLSMTVYAEKFFLKGALMFSVKKLPGHGEKT